MLSCRQVPVCVRTLGVGPFSPVLFVIRSLVHITLYSLLAIPVYRLLNWLWSSCLSPVIHKSEGPHHVGQPAGRDAFAPLSQVDPIRWSPGSLADMGRYSVQQGVSHCYHLLFRPGSFVGLGPTWLKCFSGHHSSQYTPLVPEH